VQVGENRRPSKTTIFKSLQEGALLEQDLFPSNIFVLDGLCIGTYVPDAKANRPPQS